MFALRYFDVSEFLEAVRAISASFTFRRFAYREEKRKACNSLAVTGQTAWTQSSVNSEKLHCCQLYQTRL